MTRCNRGRRQGAGSARRDSQAFDAAAREERIGVFQKTKMCKFHIMGLCTQGDGCRFAHEREQLQSLPDLSCTKLCKTLIATGCCSDPACCFAHNREELRSMPDELRRGALDPAGGAHWHQNLDLQGGPMCPGPVGAPVMQAALVQIVQASQAHAAEAARLQLMAASLQGGSQQVPAVGQCWVQGGMAPFAAAGPQGVQVAPVAPSGMVYTALPGHAWPYAQGGGVAAPLEEPLGQARAAAPVGGLCPQGNGRHERQVSGRTESTAASSDSGGFWSRSSTGLLDVTTDAADEGGGPRAPAGGPLPGRGLGAGFSMKGVTVKNTFLERVESQDFDSAYGARALRAVQTAAGRLDLMAPSLDSLDLMAP